MPSQKRKKPREPESLLDRIGDCGKCGAPLPVTKKKTKAGVVYTRPHLCSGCVEPQGAAK
jgi:hypothetical protein